MRENPCDPGKLTDENPPVVSFEPKRFQIGLKTLCLFVVAVALWTSYFVNHRQNRELESKIAVMALLVRELVVDDPSQIAIVRLEDWMEQEQWDVYLPEGKYQLWMATRDIGPTGLAPKGKSALIEAGTHHITLERRETKTGWRMTVRWDGDGQFSIEEPKDWYTGSASGMVGANYDKSTQLTAKQPVRLRGNRFIPPGRSTVPDGPVDGLVLWLEPVGT